MDTICGTILVEDEYFAPFFNRAKISIEWGEGALTITAGEMAEGLEILRDSIKKAAGN
jgi:hypothetical protein